MGKTTIKRHYKVIKDVLTEDDDTTYCWARVASTIVLALFIAGAIFDLYLTHNFQFGMFADGAMKILGGSGAAIGMKQFSSTRVTANTQRIPRPMNHVVPLENKEDPEL